VITCANCKAEMREGEGHAICPACTKEFNRLRDELRASIPKFNEADCGGVFDGHQVTSDADSGL
jgi:uncharacterized Zn finger protein (UPF0148 family)